MQGKASILCIYWHNKLPPPLDCWHNMWTCPYLLSFISIVSFFKSIGLFMNNVCFFKIILQKTQSWCDVWLVMLWSLWKLNDNWIIKVDKEQLWIYNTSKCKEQFVLYESNLVLFGWNLMKSYVAFIRTMSNKIWDVRHMFMLLIQGQCVSEYNWSICVSNYPFDVVSWTHRATR